MTKPATRAVEPAASRTREVTAVVVYPDATLRAVTLAGDDAERFAAIRRLVGGPVVSIIIDDQDGPVALGWINENDEPLPVNEIATTLVDRRVTGAMVITGPGRGDIECVTSVHDGLRAVLERMAH